MNRQALTKHKIPDKSGVYFFLQGKKILYIGKATSLRDRVKSYFSKDLINMRGPLIVDMAFKADDIKWQETDSVLEALILEANLIKKHQPYYNTKEKDNKSFNYVGITKGDVPLVIVERGKNIDFKNLRTTNYQLQTVFGPFTNGSQLREALKIIRKIFPFIDASSIKKDQYEFYRQLGLAPNITPQKISVGSNKIKDPKIHQDYLKNIKNIKLFFEGKKKKIVSALKKEMMSSAKKHDFEKAGDIKHQIFALTHINDVALIKDDFRNMSPSSSVDTGNFRIEAYDIAHMSGKDMVGVMVVLENGEPEKSEYRKFKIKQFKSSNDTGALREILVRRFGHAEWPTPNLVVIDGALAQINVARSVIKEKGLDIDIVAVVKDERHKAREIIGSKNGISKNEKQILLANSEAHRFAISYHRQKRAKSFLKKNQ